MATRTKKKPDVKFGEPPNSRRDYRWREVAEALKARPGEWALVHTDLPSSTPWAINAGRVAAVSPRLGFETKTAGNVRMEVDGKEVRVCRELWMRWTKPEPVKKNGRKK